jgi:hypothetical protein
VRTTQSKPSANPKTTDIRRQPGVYKCRHCDKVFQWPNSLYGHMRVHAEAKSPKDKAAAAAGKQRSASTSSNKSDKKVAKAKKQAKPSLSEA